jgi:hypothetical protein
VLKWRDERGAEDRGTKATDARRGSAVSGGVCERRYAAERVLPQSWFELQHAGSPSEEAAILSVVESCRRLKIPVRRYLAATLPGLADLQIQHLPELTPAAWVARHP